MLPSRVKNVGLHKGKCDMRALPQDLISWQGHLEMTQPETAEMAVLKLGDDDDL